MSVGRERPDEGGGSEGRGDLTVRYSVLQCSAYGDGRRRRARHDHCPACEVQGLRHGLHACITPTPRNTVHPPPLGELW